MTLIGSRPVQYSSTCQSGTQSIWGHGSGLVSQVPCLGNAIGVVGVIKNLLLGVRNLKYIEVTRRQICQQHHTVAQIEKLDGNLVFS